MTTWHQARRPVRRAHWRLWSVWTDPPGGFASAVQFADEVTARAHMLAAPRPHTYLVAPALDAMPDAIKALQSLYLGD